MLNIDFLIISQYNIGKKEPKLLILLHK